MQEIETKQYRLTEPQIRNACKLYLRMQGAVLPKDSDVSVEWEEADPIAINFRVKTERDI